jgi:hypothetical protein
VYVITHEYVHVQQSAALADDEYPTVLAGSLMEGAAEFVAELTARSVAYSQLTADTRGHEKEIETAFVPDEDQKDLSHWLYNSTADKHGDLGYWVGYRIVKACYQSSKDKPQALREILQMTDPHAFAEEERLVPGNKALNLPRPREPRHVVGRSKRQRLNGHCRLAPTGSHEARAIADKQVGHVVGAMVWIGDGVCRFPAHSAGAEQMDRIGLLPHLFRPDLLGTGRLHDLRRAIPHKSPGGQIIRVILVGHAYGRDTPGVLQTGIQADAVGFQGQ